MGLRKFFKSYEGKFVTPTLIITWVIVGIVCAWMQTKSDTPTSDFITILLLALLLIDTVIIIFMALRLGRNIRVLRDFTLRAGKDPNFVPPSKFTDDQLGEIVRQIVEFFNERSIYVQRLNREHEVAIHALKDKARVKHELTNNLNHHLKTPVCVIKGYIDTMLQHPDIDDETRQRFLLKINDNVDRLNNILNDLSSITRLDYGSNMIHTEPVNLHEVVFQAASEYENSGMLGCMKFNFDIPTYCRVIGNHAMLRTILNNLTKNAVSYSGGSECCFILTGEDTELYHFAFYDNGIGVKEEDLPKLFERFFRAEDKQTTNQSGTGLGLSIVLSTIEALGGTISAANRLGGGLIYRFSLQRAK